MAPAPAPREPEYDPAAIEPKWQERWREERLFESRRDPARSKYYCYNPAPYVTGALHMGHVRNYTCGDFVSRYQRLRGAAVLYTIGFDAFGLPTEMAAIRHACDPADWTSSCLIEMKRQLVALGCGFDWSRSFITSDPEYYRWTQWLFLQLREQDLVYSTVGDAHWCPQCETSLAHAQVIDGGCWICGSTVERRRVREWRLRLIALLGDLKRGLHEMTDLNGLAAQGQNDLIGAQEGFKVELRVVEGSAEMAAFMARREDWRSHCIVAMDPRDEESLRRLPPAEAVAAVPGAATPGTAEPGREETVTREFREAVLRRFPEGRLAGVCATEARSGRKLPVVIVSLNEPAYAAQPVVLPVLGLGRDASIDAAPGFSPMTLYRQKDFSISRQRVWGTPIPIVLCETCGEVPVPAETLPVVAPRVVFDPASQRLRREDPAWDQRACPRCTKPARLDPQVMDCHMDSIWHPFRPCAGERNEFLFDPEEMRYWMPADIIQFGRDVIPFMLDLRFLSHFLHRLGRIPFREFCRQVLAHGLILHEGRKMSKHLGNVVTPDEIIRRFGADSLRFYTLARAEPKSDLRWSEEGIQRYRDLLRDHYNLVRDAGGDRAGDAGDAGETARPVSGRLGHYTAVFLRKAAREVAWLETSVEPGRYDRYAGALARLLAAIDFFRAQHLAKETQPRFRLLWPALIRDSVLYLAPVAPHLAEKCWELLGNRESIFAAARAPECPASALNELLAAHGQASG